jgi:hypothetical protein
MEIVEAFFISWLSLRKFKKVALFASLIFALLGSAKIARALESPEDSRVKAPRGGDIKQIRDGYIEVVSNRKVIKIYLYDKKLKPEKQLKNFSIIAEVQRATAKEHENLELRPTDGAFTAKFDPGDTSKFYLDIGIANRKTGSADRTSFSIDEAAKD